MSDADSVGDLVTHGLAADKADAAVRALTAGVDMEMTFPGSAVGSAYANSLAKLVAEKRLPTAQIDNAARRILEVKFRLGIFDNPFVDESAAAAHHNNPEHRQFARVAAQRSTVLLRNENNFLPVAKGDPKVSSIAVIGPLADSKRDMRGPWTLADDMRTAISVVEGIRAKVGPKVKIDYAQGVDIGRAYPSIFAIFGNPRPAPWSEEQRRAEFEKALALARSSDLVVLVLGEHEEMSGEAATHSTIDLPGRQRELLEAISALGKPAVLVLINGRPVDISWAVNRVPAILEAWHPGSEGGNAIADLLYGDATPGAKLPVTWPRSSGQIPIYYAHNLTQKPETAKHFTSRYWDIPSTPLYPFGYGLSYTTFAYSNLRLNKATAKAGESVEVSVDVENTGRRAGDEVAQLYIHQCSGSASRPVRELKGFERIALAPGEKKTVRFTLGSAELTYWSSAVKSWVLEPATFDIYGPVATRPRR